MQEGLSDIEDLSDGEDDGWEIDLDDQNEGKFVTKKPKIYPKTNTFFIYRDWK